ncbi:MAG: hypothetical protein P4L50_12155 [Anaerolineaceae bacterium]|nr:hypothetical protein [Anaerolineaceae bacterium]
MPRQQLSASIISAIVLFLAGCTFSSILPVPPNQDFAPTVLKLTTTKLPAEPPVIATQLSQTAIIENPEIAFSTMVPLEDMNKSIVVGLSPFVKSELKNDSQIYLQAENKSNQEIWLPVEGRIKIYRFILSTHSWEQITNDMNYYGNGREIENGDIFFPKNSKEGNYIDITPCVPKIDNLDQTVTIRIVV